MTDRIIISFDDEITPEDNNEQVNSDNSFTEKSESNSIPEYDVVTLTPGLSEEIKASEINSFYNANPTLTGFFDTKLKYPEGTDSGFNRNYSLELEDEFFSSVLVNNEHIILTSRNSKVYFIDRFSPVNKKIIHIENSNFEKTGCVIKNDIFLNSLSGIYYLKSGVSPEKDSIKTVFTSPDGTYIWSNLNFFNNNILFLTYDGVEKANLLLIDIMTGNKIFDFSFDALRHLSGSVLVSSGRFFLFADNFILIFESSADGKLNVIRFDLGFEINPETKFIALKNKVFINDPAGNIFYFNITSEKPVLHFSGIKTAYLNSLSGFGNFIFTGCLGGWKAFDINGMEIFSHPDIDENKIAAINPNILVISRFNKIIFHNLNRFQEAESYAITGIKSESTGIISALFDFSEIFILTEGGILESYSNKRLNINI